MTTYLFKCPECGAILERTVPEPREGFCHEVGKDVLLQRAWKAEGVSMSRVPGGGREFSG